MSFEDPFPEACCQQLADTLPLRPQDLGGTRLQPYQGRQVHAGTARNCYACTPHWADKLLTGALPERHFALIPGERERARFYSPPSILWSPLWKGAQAAGERDPAGLAGAKNSGLYPHMPNQLPSYFHLHLISDATGETLTTMAKAAAVQYAQVRPIEHVHPLVRTPKQLERVLKEVEQSPGIVLYTIVKAELIEAIERRCRELKVPSLHVLQPIMRVFESYLGAPQTPVVAGQHLVDADYFRRIDALNFAMAHDDGQLPQDLNSADIIILGISRTSKTPTSIYLAQRGYKTANLPLVPGIEPPRALLEPHRAFVVGLVASPERIAEIRRNRVRMLADRNLDEYVDRAQIANELSYSRRLCSQHGWPVIDVTRRSIEETAATIIRLLHDREEAVAADHPRELEDG